MRPAGILLCESATENADGTWQLVRAGITHWELESFPGAIKFTLFIRLPGLPPGKHKGTLTIENPEGGKDVLEVHFTAPTAEPVALRPQVELLPKKVGVVTMKFELADIRGAEKLTIRQKKAGAKAN